MVLNSMLEAKPQFEKKGEQKKAVHKHDYKVDF